MEIMKLNFHIPICHLRITLQIYGVYIVRSYMAGVQSHAFLASEIDFVYDNVQ